MNRRNAIINTGVIAGTSILIPSFLTLLQSCKNEPRLSWQPLFFKVEEAEFIGKLVDIILPRTETPGALDVKVDVFLDKVFAKTYNQEAQQKIRADIAQFNADCKQDYGSHFTGLSEEKQIAVLKDKEKTSGKFGGSVWGTAVGKQAPVGFYRSIKSMALWAYFSSEEIGKNVLNYDPVPMAYDGCVPLSDIGNKWSL